MSNLNLPKVFSFATNANRTIDPEDTAGLVVGDGWNYSDRVPPKTLNWFQNSQGLWTRAALIRRIGNVKSVQALAAPAYHVCRDYTSKIWMINDGAAGQTYYSYNGVVWTLSGYAPGVASSAVTTNLTNGVIFGDSAGLKNSTNGVAFASTAHANITGLAAQKTPTARFLCGHSAGAAVHFWATGIAGGATAPTTTSWGANFCRALVAMGGTSWGMVDTANDFHFSSDDGVNWVKRGNPGALFANFVAESIACDADSGALVCVGSNSAGTASYIAYSTNGGVAWSAATYRVPGYLGAYVGADMRAVESVGSNAFIAGGDTGVTGYAANLLFSVDGGATWAPVCVQPIGTLIAGSHVRHIWCGRDRIVITTASNADVLTTDNFEAGSGDF